MKKLLIACVVVCSMLLCQTQVFSAVPEKYQKQIDRLDGISISKVQEKFFQAIYDNNIDYVIDKINKIDVNFLSSTYVESVDSWVETTPLGLATILERMEVVKLLEKHGAHIDNPLETILLAARAGRLTVSAQGVAPRPPFPARGGGQF